MQHLDVYSQKQLRQLFDVMNMGPVRVIAGGPIDDWLAASADDINTFLISWRDSIIPIKRMGYTSLSKMIVNCWYALPENYAQAGYPGPPKKLTA